MLMIPEESEGSQKGPRQREQAERQKFAWQCPELWQEGQAAICEGHCSVWARGRRAWQSGRAPLVYLSNSFRERLTLKSKCSSY